MQTYLLEANGESLSLALHEREAPQPGPHDIVVRVKAVSLNKRDLFILNRSYPLPARPGVVPVSDGAGEVIAVGSRVTRFRIGDRVAGQYFARWRSGPLAPELFDQLGCTLDGMLAEQVVLNEQWAVRVPERLSWIEAATLPCAGVTAWNCINGPQPVQAGQTVLVLGSGGVSLFALQFAKSQGARVMATTASEDKAARLKALGADAVINYREQPEWGAAVRQANGGAGVDLVVETFGPDTIEQSMRAVGLHGQVMLLIARGATKPDIQISAQAYGMTMATIRRVFVGHRDSFEAMNRAVTQANVVLPLGLTPAGGGSGEARPWGPSPFGIRPVIDCVFPFHEAPAAFRHFARGQSFGKVVITLE